MFTKIIIFYYEPTTKQYRIFEILICETYLNPDCKLDEVIYNFQYYVTLCLHVKISFPEFNNSKKILHFIS